MEIKEILKTAFISLKTNKTRSLLTMLGVIIGVSSVILLVAIGNGLKSYITNQLESLGANSIFVMPGEINIGSGQEGGGMPGAGVAASQFTFTHLNQIKRGAKTVKIIMPYTENNGTMRYRGKTHITQVVGVGPEFESVKDQYVIEGAFFTQGQYHAAKRVAVLGQTVAEELFGEENPVGKKMTISNQRYTVLGVLEEKGGFGGLDQDNQVFIPGTTALRQFDMNKIQSFWIQSLNSNTVEETKQEVEKILLKSLDEDEFSVVDTQNILQVVGNVLGVLTAALGGIAAISLIVGGVGIMNIMLVSVTERTREVGLRKALGATPQTILRQFLIEAVVLSTSGGVIGILLGAAGALLVNQFFPAQITFWAVVLAFGVSAAIGSVFGVAPAAKAARLNPIEALRYE